jgi:hypothetical protein
LDFSIPIPSGELLLAAWLMVFRGLFDARTSKILNDIRRVNTTMNLVHKTASLRIGFNWLAFSFLVVSPVNAANQTADITPIQFNSALPYQITLQEYDFGPEELPTLHSFNAAHYDGKWILFAGRTNGLHGFAGPGPRPENFPASSQNKEVWVIDPVAKQSWHRALDGPTGGLTTTELRSLTPANTQFLQRGDYLYVTGGYGIQTDLAGGLNGTFDTLSAIHLPGIMDWVINNNGTAKDRIRQISDPAFQVTGGAMYEVDGRAHLVFGQRFNGNYGPGTNGTYTNQVRSFDIIDDGTPNGLSFANLMSTTPDATKYRRRDLNVFPVVRPDGVGGLDQQIVALSGVFTTTDGIWTVPVEVDPNGLTTNIQMDDPNLPETFKQGFNGYHSAKLGLYSEAREEMHEVLFGGISLQFFDTATQSVMEDPFMPFINDITSVVIDENGDYSQHWLGQYPEITQIVDTPGGPVEKRLRFGANAEFFLADGIPTYDNGVIRLDALTQPTVLGYIYGGIESNSPHTRDSMTGQPIPFAQTGASQRIFTVLYTPVPEPSTLVLLVIGTVSAFLPRRRGASRLTRSTAK